MNNNNNPYLSYLMSINPELAKQISAFNQQGQPNPYGQQAPQAQQGQVYTPEQINNLIDDRLKQRELQQIQEQQQRNYEVLANIINAIVPKELQEIIVARQASAHALLNSPDMKTLATAFADAWKKYA